MQTKLSERPIGTEPEPGYQSSLIEVAALADGLIFLSKAEMKLFKHQTGLLPKESRLIHNRLMLMLFPLQILICFGIHMVSQTMFCVVGRIEHRKNQLLLALALREAGLPLVLVGHAGDVEYRDFISRFGGTNILYVDRLAHDSNMLRSAIAGCRVFALPSWTEGAPLAALEAAAAGVKLVLSDRSSEREYFGSMATYCDPSDILIFARRSKTHGIPNPLVAKRKNNHLS